MHAIYLHCIDRHYICMFSVQVRPVSITSYWTLVHRVEKTNMARNYYKINEGFDGHRGTQFGSTSILFDILFLQCLHRFIWRKKIEKMTKKIKSMPLCTKCGIVMSIKHIYLYHMELKTIISYLIQYQSNRIETDWLYLRVSQMLFNTRCCDHNISTTRYCYQKSIN